MLKFLIIEDDEGQRALLKTILKKNFTCEIRETDNGETVFEMLKSEIPSLLFLDLNMPVMDGHQVLEKLYSNILYRNIPVVVTTATNDRDIVGTLIGKGIYDYLLKPLDVNSTINRINKVISRITEATPEFHDALDSYKNLSLLLIEPDKHQRELINELIGDKFIISDVSNGLEAVSSFQKQYHRFILVSDKVGLLDKKIITQKIREISAGKNLSIFLIYTDERTTSAKVFSFDGLIKRSIDTIQFKNELLNKIISGPVSQN